MNDISSNVIIVICIIVLIYVLVREFNCWYWKINERNKLLEYNNKKLDDICSLLEFLIPVDSNITETGMKNEVIVSKDYDGNKTIIKYANGAVYEGEVCNNIPEGTGKMKYVNGDIFEGRFVAGKAEGKGLLTDGTNKRIEVIFKDGVLIEKKTI